MTSQALEGVRVLDLTRHVAGPLCTKLLADYGADVIKIEAPGRGDPARWIAPFLHDTPHPERSGLFLHLNTNKRGITLDLKTETGRAIFLKLLPSADIVVENFRPRVMPSLGLDYAALSKIKPSLVMTSISNFGQTGPYRDWSASDLIVYAMGHEMWGTGQPDCEPAGMANKLSLHIAGEMAFTATLGAFYGALFQGAGQQVDLSIMEVMASSIDRRAPSLLAYQYCGERAERVASVNGIDAPPFVNYCADGFFEITVGIQWWPDFVRAIGEDWIKDRAMRPPVRDVKVRERFDSYWIPWCMARTKKEIVAIFQKAGIPCAPLNTTEDLTRDPQLTERGFFIEIDHPAAGRLTYPGAPFRLPESPFKIRRPAPMLGQHNAELLGELGYDANDLAALSAAGVI
jgi:crotonobetainyl-CoA:carnitine CoA-transferase CaiB-like acyl-CoA transferase